MICYKKTRYQPYLFLVPYFLVFLCFNMFPIVYSFKISLSEWNGIGSMEFVGFKNYSNLISDKLFYKSLSNVMTYMVISIPLLLVTGLFLAVVIKEYFGRSRRAIQVINFLPNLTTPVAIGIIFQMLFDWQYGIINSAFKQIGIQEQLINWLGDPSYARMVMIVLLWWKSFGYYMILISAGLFSVSESIYEAAKIDGAKGFSMLTKITLPLLKPILTFLIVMSIIWELQMFDEPQVLFNSSMTSIGGPGNVAYTAIMHFYNTAFKGFRLGQGASIAYGLFILIFIFSLSTIKAMRRSDRG